MNKKYIDKYNKLEVDFFSTGANFAYDFKYKNKKYTLDVNDNGKYVLFTKDPKDKQGPFDNIYAALDGIKLDDKTLRQLLLETDFEFDFIS